ncbi:aspartate/methionine/tyrosine aminotransferase [Sulfitobacter undariae]|uniref:aspartate transaminase n=1 Tax=Sulfitobacter undariae TaxID=1563671 RepID=A0A7W6E314_9RHOB|nr:aminotransferase [Sulfitobacter undariae]MBB3993820.1 aspartate/methionine/tyrosine aminotransferase [Sulfitobacter undariae]
MTLPRTATTFPPPVMEARRWLEGVNFTTERPLINVSQAAPVEAPHPDMRKAMADAVIQDDAMHLYGPVLGMPELRSELAARTSRIYSGTVAASQVAITSGCNQAFAAAIATLCAEGDEVIIPVPWYFNHKMWLDMAGAKAVPLKCEGDMMPDPWDAAKLITPRTRAIVLVTPNNPTGAEYPDDLITAFYDIAKSRGIALIVDETYRDFHSSTDIPHSLFQRPDWDDTLIHLYSFSKAYRLTGHRVGAVAASEARLAEVEKFLDTVAICPNQIGQYAALWGMQNLDQWLAGERDEILTRRAAITENLSVLEAKGWTLLGLGGYFAYLRHPFALSSADLAPALVRDAGVLTLPGTMFYPKDAPEGANELRIAFANLDAAGIATLFARLEAVDLPLR